ncbi:MAG: Txe/YoeB family addiction module toxin [Rikenellaceae bacterium]
MKRHAKSGNKNIIRKIESLLNELSEHPRSGTGKPEQLKGFEVETWSRRLDNRHRLIYEINDEHFSCMELRPLAIMMISRFSTLNFDVIGERLTSLSFFMCNVSA